MKLYFTKGACSLVVRIICNELNLNIDYEAVDLRAKKTSAGEDYYAINPKGAVPALQLDDKQILTENSAILQYLADTHHADQLLPTVGDFSRYRVIEWLGYMNSEVHKNFGGLLNKAIPEEIKQNIFLPMLKSKFEFLDKNLQQKKYLLGDNFTLPDAYLFVMIRWLSIFKIDIAGWSNLDRYYNELKSRKSIQKSLADEG
jgi:glutathione S-transferase